MAALLTLAPAAAQETISYTYDGRGRLIQTDHSGTANNGVTSCYAYDAADNRTAAGVATSGACSASGPVSFSISSNGAITEGANSVFTITKTGTASTSLSVSYATANGTAAAPGDYTAKSGTLTFTTAQNSLTVSVATIDDTTVESAETFSMSLSAPTGGATIDTGTATATINDNDSNPCSGVSFAVNNTSVTEGGNLVFTITKTGSTSGSCSVNYATANGTAAAGSDYTAKSGTLTFSSTQTSKTVSVVTIDDSTVENAETVKLNLSNATGGATISDSQGIGTINDNDSAGVCSGISFTVGNAAGVEGTTLVFTVAKTGSTSSSCSVNYATADGTATAGIDYFAVSGTLTFTSTQTSKTVSVSTVDNQHLVDRTMYLNLSSPTGGATLANSQGTGTLIHTGGGGGGGCDPFCQSPALSPSGSTTDQPADSTSDPGTADSQPPPGGMSSHGVSDFERRIHNLLNSGSSANSIFWSLES